MKLTLALLFPLACFANYPSQQSVILDVGATQVILTDSASGTSQTLIYGPGSGHRLRLTFSPINVPPPSGTSYSACADPCTITMARNWGVQHQFEELTNNSGTPLNSVGPHHSTLPMIEPAADAAGAWTFPIEVIGQDYFVKRVQVTNPGSTRTNLRLELRLNNMHCGIPPYDTKASVQINGGAATANDGNWIAVSNSTITQLDKNNYYGAGSAAHGDWDIVNGPIPQGSIGATPATIDVTVPISDNLVTTGTNTIGFRSYCPDGKTSGYRVLHLNLQDTSTIKTMDQIVVSSNVGTARTTATNTYATNDWLFVYGAPGMMDRFNGARQVTVNDTTHFHFTTCGGDSNTILSGACTAPNGTYTVPTTQQGAIAMATQPVMYVVREILAEPVAAWDDPTTWTAPSGGNAGAGATLWTTPGMVNPNQGYINDTISVSCADCHTVTGIDLKYLNFSNWSIMARSGFHGLTDQQQKNIAAFIRGVSATVPANARVWNGLNQPGPGVDSGTVNVWAAGCGIGCELYYGPDAKEYMIPSGSYASWETNARMSAHNTPIMWQMPTWMQVIPAIHPADMYPTGGFASSNLNLDYLNFRANVTAGNFTSYKTWATGQTGSYQPIANVNIGTFGNALSIPNGAGQEAPGYIYPSMYLTGAHSVEQWASTKTWELEKEFGLETMCSQVYTDLYGAATSAAGYLDRCWFSPVPFNLAFHKNFIGTYHNTDNTTASSYNYQSNQTYIWQEILNNGNLRETGDFTMDVPYTWAFLGGAGQYFPSSYLNFYKMITASQSSWDEGLVASGAQQESFNIYGFNPRFPVNVGTRYYLAFDDATSVTTLYNKYLDLFAENITKGNTAAWQTWGTSGPGAGISDCTTGAVAAYLQGGTLCDGVAFMLPVLAFYGANSAKLDAVQTWAQAVYPTHNFAYDRSANASGVVSVSGNTVTYVSGDDFTNFPVNGSAVDVNSYMYLAGTAYAITAVASNHSLTLGGSPPAGTQAYNRCVAVNPGSVAPAYPTCGNT